MPACCSAQYLKNIVKRSENGPHYAPRRCVGERCSLGLKRSGGSAQAALPIAAGSSAGVAISRDAGSSWAVTQSAQWGETATSVDGSAVIVGGTLPVSISTDSGQNWAQVNSNAQGFSSYLISGDDQKVLAGADGGPIYALSEVSTAGIAGAVSGKRDQSITLQYTGNGTFLVISNEGQLTVQ